MASRESKLLYVLAFPALEAVAAAPAGGSASRSRANKNKGLRAGLSGAGMERWSRQDPSCKHSRHLGGTLQTG